jgi:hypothetical protein
METESPEEPCEHEDREDQWCLICDQEIEMRWEWEHDSKDMER